jgi:hypothetical protein
MVRLNFAKAEKGANPEATCLAVRVKPYAPFVSCPHRNFDTGDLQQKLRKLSFERLYLDTNDRNTNDKLIKWVCFTAARMLAE